MGINDIPMRALLADAGVGPGMRVLDLGCGPGAVTRLIAELVGPDGEVLGVDRSAGALELARTASREAGLMQCHYREHDLMQPLADAGTFDAVVGRRVLMYLPDPQVALGWAVPLLRVGGRAVFWEMDHRITPASAKPLPLHDQVAGWIKRTVEAEGGNLGIGLEMPGRLEQVGLTVQDVRVLGDVEGHPDSMATIVRFILPRIVERLEVSEAEIELDTLHERLEDERRQVGVTYLRNLSVGVWAERSA